MKTKHILGFFLFFFILTSFFFGCEGDEFSDEEEVFQPTIIGKWSRITTGVTGTNYTWEIDFNENGKWTYESVSLSNGFICTGSGSWMISGENLTIEENPYACNNYRNSETTGTFSFNDTGTRLTLVDLSGWSDTWKQVY